MQSLRQYRRIRAAVEHDLAQSKRPSDAAVDLASLGANSPTPTGSSHDSDTSASVPPQLPGVTSTRPAEDDGAVTYIVGWKDDDPLNPQNWSLAKKWAVTLAVCLLTLAITLVSSIDAPVAPEFNAYYGVGAVAGSLTTGLYLIGSGVGALFAGTVSETFGRNVVYMSTFAVFLLFVIAKALAPDYGGAVTFRFLTGFFGSTPMTAAGGSMADVWGPLQMVYAVPFATMTSYAGPLLGPVVGAYLPRLGFRWADWVALIFGGAVLVYVVLWQPETYRPVLLEWRAERICELTGNDRHRIGDHATAHTLGRRLLVNIYRPFLMVRTEPIILIFTFYLTVIYVVLFTFLNGYPFIFQQTYGISRSLTFILWTALLLTLPLIPLVYGWAKKAAAAGALTPEICLWYGMLGGSIALPVSLWWMAWTCYPSVNIWVPIVGFVFFGYGLVTIFTTTFIYTVFVYQMHSASALAFLTSVRYVVAGAVIPASVPMYERLGPHKALTIPAVLATLMAPVPFVLYKYGAKIRGMSKMAPQLGIGKYLGNWVLLMVRGLSVLGGGRRCGLAVSSYTFGQGLICK
ncbi:Major facilitator superfamily domain- general substrate transporter [Apiospora hydei]|uniref:Major facilitator superfamily domain- general substrate transporter n=1 Tax=Apiospora hydei TaxID=1337664 RepID=A0ABR1X9I2_9PEZI